MKISALLLLGFVAAAASAQPSLPVAYPDQLPPLTGSYEGERLLDDGTVQTVYAQAIPLGNEQYELRLRPTMRTGPEPHVVLQGQADGAFLSFAPAMGTGRDRILQITGHGLLVDASLYEVTIEGERIRGFFAGKERGRLDLKKVPHAEPPTLGAAPPEGALVLFDGTDLEAWHNRGKQEAVWEIKDGAFEVVPRTGNLLTNELFGSFHLHLEFRTPYMPDKGGQARGNSGVYLHGRYEIQVLDSFGLEGEWNECGGIYKVARPLVNMAAPPTVWQTYDVYFRAPEFGSTGEKVRNARVTVVHNGVTIHEDRELPGPTGGAHMDKELPEGPLMLQDHGDPVQYRNIWIMEN